MLELHSGKGLSKTPLPERVTILGSSEGDTELRRQVSSNMLQGSEKYHRPMDVTSFPSALGGYSEWG